MAAKSSENENRRRSVRGQGKVHQNGRGEVFPAEVETSPLIDRVKLQHFPFFPGE